MTKGKFRIIVILLIISLVGIVSLQYTMLKESYIQKEQIFDQTVSSALIDVSKKVEKQEAINFIQTKISRKKKEKNISNKNVVPIEPELTKAPTARKYNHFKNPILARKSAKALKDSLSNANFNFFRNEDYETINIFGVDDIQDSIFAKSMNQLPEYFEFVYDSSGNLIQKNNKVSKTKGTRTIVRVVPPKPPVIASHPEFPILVQPAPAIKLNNKLKEVRQKEKINLIEEIATEMQVVSIPIEKRIDTVFIDSILKIELLKRGVNYNYDVIIQSNDDGRIFFKTSDLKNVDDFAFYSIGLFEDNNGNAKANINLTFTDKQRIISNQMWPSIIVSIVLLITLLSIFIYTIRAILKQKKLSDLKNDFINNMTHEFKTPVSTILLASEALKDNSITNDDTRVKRLAGIIYDENQRLSEHVERVLNMASMDKGEVKLAMNRISLHETLNNCVKHFELNLESKSQKIEIKLNAKNDFIYVDEFHLKNIIHNLIDNASKYSKSDTTIFIETENLKSDLILKIRDQGIGMRKEQVKKIFEPFYRVPTGNLHDVKGFGIGLHYVHSILKLMGGKINVRSEFGLGTEFSVTFENK